MSHHPKSYFFDRKTNTFFSIEEIMQNVTRFATFFSDDLVCVFFSVNASPCFVPHTNFINGTDGLSRVDIPVPIEYPVKFVLNYGITSIYLYRY